MSPLLTALEKPASMRNGIPGVEPRLRTSDLPPHLAAASDDSLAIQPMERPAGDNTGGAESAAGSWAEDHASTKAPGNSTQWAMRHRRNRIIIACALLAAIACGGLVYIEVEHPDWRNHAPWQSSSERGASATIPAQSDAIKTGDLPAPVEPSPVGDASPLRLAESTTVPRRTTPGRSEPERFEADPKASQRESLANQPAKSDRMTNGKSEPDAAALMDPESVTDQDGHALTSIVRSKALDEDHALRNAWYAFTAGKDREALHIYRSALQRGSVRSDAMLGAAAALTHLGLHDQARHHYLTVLEMDPSNAAARSNLLALRIRTGENPSEQEIIDLIAEEPSDFLYALLGHIRAAGHRWSDAREAFETALHIQPASAVHAFNLAVSLEHLGLMEQALDSYRRAASRGDTTVRSEFDRELLVRRISMLSHAGGN